MEIQNTNNFQIATDTGFQKYLQQQADYLFIVDDVDQKKSITAQLDTLVPSKGICAKKIVPGDMGWSCKDCERDTTSILCLECFEMSDHVGHQVVLKRNASGLCDCGDPDAWDPNHFCPKHKGQSTVASETIIMQIPGPFRIRQGQIFCILARLLKMACAKLKQAPSTMSNRDLIRSILNFYMDRLDESAAFAYLIESELSKTWVDTKNFTIDTCHTGNKKCPERIFLDTDIEQKEEFEQVFLCNAHHKKLCSCNTLDLLLQVNKLLDTQTRKVFYDLCLKMFPSIHFKQALTVSFAANYKTIMQSKNGEDHCISQIGVQLMTSDEMSILIFKNKSLRDNLIDFVVECLAKIKELPDTSRLQQDNKESDTIYKQLWIGICHLKYMARPRSLQFGVQETDFLEKVISCLQYFYFIDVKKPRTAMIPYMQQGSYDSQLLNRELHMIEIIQIYLQKLLDINDHQRTHSVFRAFLISFQTINDQVENLNLQKSGLMVMPLHRCFAFFLTKLLLKQKRDPALSLQQNFRETLRTFMSSCRKCNSNLILDQSLRKILKTSLHSLGFVHEIMARKWIYYGYYLEHYPKVYHHVPLLSYSDLALFQMLLACDNTEEEQETGINTISQLSSPLIEHIISNFGLDQQLTHLLQGIKKRDINDKMFSRFRPPFDQAKVKIQLIQFLRFMAQISIVEVSFLRQIMNASKQFKPNILDPNYQEFQDLWAHAAKREAVHLLLTNKVNSNIGDLKKNMNQIFKNDPIFEKAIFEVSTQSRDSQNQLCFKLKDEYHAWFDPYLYYIPDKNSAIYQYYEQNNLKDKFRDLGFNILVGDYEGRYKMATDVNMQICKNIARSSMVQIVCRILSVYLKYSKGFQTVDDFDFEHQLDLQQLGQKVQKTDDGQEVPVSAAKTLMLANNQLDMMRAGSIHQQSSFLSKVLSNKEKAKKNQQKSETAPSQGWGISQNSFGRLRKEDIDRGIGQIFGPVPPPGFFDLEPITFSQPQTIFDTKYLSEFVDSNVGNHCLKLLLQILQAHTESKMAWALSDKIRLIDELKYNKYALVYQLMRLHGEGSSDNDDAEKTQKVILHILKLIYRLNEEQFQVLDKRYGFSNASIGDISPEKKLLEEKKETKSQTIDEKKEKMRLKKSKMMAKMKKKADKFITKDSELKPEPTPVTQQIKEEELIQCPFCFEDLVEADFKDKPFGNFCYVQASKFVYHSTLQTLRSQRTAFKNADLSTQGIIQEKSGTSNDFCQEDGALCDNELLYVDQDEEVKESEMKKLKVLNLPHTLGNYLNKHTGSGAIVTNCKHYAHISCLRDYIQQQTTLNDRPSIHQRQLRGFTQEEFACPICNSINNTILPFVSLQKLSQVHEPLQFPKDTSIKITSEMKQTLDIYVDFLAEIIQKQQGVVDKTLHNSEVLTRKLMLKDLKSEPERILKLFVQFFNHSISIIDQKGFNGLNFKALTNVFQSFQEVFKFALNGLHSVLDFQTKDLQEILNEQVQKIFEEDLEGNFELPEIKSNVLAKCVNLMVLTSIGLNHQRRTQDLEKHLTYICQRFSKLFNSQFQVAACFRKTNGKMIRGFDILVQEANTDKDDSFVEIQLSVMKKLFAAFVIIMGQDEQDSIIKQVQNTKSNFEELQFIRQYIGFGKDHESDLGKGILQCLSHFTDENILSQLHKFAKNEDGQITLMPSVLALMTPYYQFDLYEIPRNFLDLQTQYLKRPCQFCKRDVIDTATCLLSGKTVCWFLNGSRKQKEELKQCKVGPSGQQQLGEGLMTWHSRVNEGGCAMFLQASTGYIVMIQNGSSSFFDSPYRNTYGELSSDAGDRNLQAFQIDEEGGGFAIMKKVKQAYVDFKVRNDILQARTNPKPKFKIFQSNQM